jgi:hypothetical protein
VRDWLATASFVTDSNRPAEEGAEDADAATAGEENLLLRGLTNTLFYWSFDRFLFFRLSTPIGRGGFMESWLVHHWIELSGGGCASLWPFLRLCRFLRVRCLVLKGESWTFEYRRRRDLEVD